MKNKEIVERLKDSLDYEFDLSFSDRKQLLSYIEQLETDYKEAIESITWWRNRYNAVERDKKQLQQENQQLKKQKDDVVEYIKNYDVFKEFSFPLMKKWEENQVKSSIDYQFKESIKKDLLRMLGEKE